MKDIKFIYHVCCYPCCPFCFLLSNEFFFTFPDMLLKDHLTEIYDFMNSLGPFSMIVYTVRGNSKFDTVLSSISTDQTHIYIIWSGSTSLIPFQDKLKEDLRLNHRSATLPVIIITVNPDRSAIKKKTKNKKGFCCKEPLRPVLN